MEHSKNAPRERRYTRGENHPNCRISDEDVDLIVALGTGPGRLTPRQILAKFDDYDPPLGLTTIKDILNGRKRGRRD